MAPSSCRCTGYANIIKAVITAGREIGEGAGA
jgi:aerobic-type carbon monoxide dehydrogenase small subunit (CoxS/CutS family)